LVFISIEDTKESMYMISLHNLEKNKIRISNKLGEYFEIITSLGGIISRLVLTKKHIPIIIAPVSRIAESGYQSAKLSPYANRINKGAYAFNKVRYKLPANTKEGHSIHGLVYNKAFNVKSVKSNSVTLNHSYNRDTQGYPFKYEINVTYSLFQGRLDITTTALNKDKQVIPYMDGWHHYFSLGKIDDLELKIPKTILYETKSMIPTGKTIKMDAFSTLKRIGNTNFDNCLKSTGSIMLVNRRRNVCLTISQQIGKRKYNYVQIYTPKDRKSIAVEPMSGIPDCFNNGIGLIKLKPNERFNAKYEIKLENLS